MNEKQLWPFENLSLSIMLVCIDPHFKINLNIYPSLNLGLLLFFLACPYHDLSFIFHCVEGVCGRLMV